MQKKNKIVIQGARENNLKNIDLEIPRDLQKKKLQCKNWEKSYV